MRRIIFILLLLVLQTLQSTAQNTIVADRVFRANRHNLHFPNISTDYPFVDLRSSHIIQKAYVDLKQKDDKIAGYKAALTSKKAQARFSAATPVAGVLFESGKLHSPDIIKLDDTRNSLIETEIGYLVDNDIIQTIESYNELGGLITKVYPVVELPDVGYKDLSKINVIDIISTNAGSKNYIFGKRHSIEQIDIDNIKTKLFHDGKMISSGISTNVMENQRSALLWLINDILSRGYEIKSGHILLTGAFGTINKAQTGLYMGDFGSLGKIYFEIK